MQETQNTQDNREIGEGEKCALINRLAGLLDVLPSSMGGELGMLVSKLKEAKDYERAKKLIPLLEGFSSGAVPVRASNLVLLKERLVGEQPNLNYDALRNFVNHFWRIVLSNPLRNISIADGSLDYDCAICPLKECPNLDCMGNYEFEAEEIGLRVGKTYSLSEIRRLLFSKPVIHLVD